MLLSKAYFAYVFFLSLSRHHYFSQANLATAHIKPHVLHLLLLVHMILLKLLGTFALAMLVSATAVF